MVLTMKRYNKRIIPYVPSSKNGYCLCGLLFHGPFQNVCKMCDSREFAVILQSLQFCIDFLNKNNVNIHEVFVICWVFLIYQ